MKQLSIWSVEYRSGRSMVIKRKWFGTYDEAERWMSAPAQRERDITGPHTHIVVGRAGLVSILTTYAS